MDSIRELEIYFVIKSVNAIRMVINRNEPVADWLALLKARGQLKRGLWEDMSVGKTLISELVVIAKGYGIPKEDLKNYLHDLTIMAMGIW